MSATPDPIEQRISQLESRMNRRQSEKEVKILELQFQYAFEYFKFHAQQRTTMFNFFLIAFGVLASAIAVLIERKLFSPGGILALVGAFISLGFICLDFRNKHLVHYGENVLEFLEEAELFKGQRDKRGITLGFILRERQDREMIQNLFKHSLWIPLIQLVACTTFAVTAATLFWFHEWLIGPEEALRVQVPEEALKVQILDAPTAPPEEPQSGQNP